MYALTQKLQSDLCNTIISPAQVSLNTKTVQQLEWMPISKPTAAHVEAVTFVQYVSQIWESTRFYILCGW